MTDSLDLTLGQGDPRWIYVINLINSTRFNQKSIRRMLGNELIKICTDTFGRTCMRPTSLSLLFFKTVWFYYCYSNLFLFVIREPLKLPQKQIQMISIFSHRILSQMEKTLNLKFILQIDIQWQPIVITLKKVFIEKTATIMQFISRISLNQRIIVL